MIQTSVSFHQTLPEICKFHREADTRVFVTCCWTRCAESADQNRVLRHRCSQGHPTTISFLIFAIFASPNRYSIKKTVVGCPYVVLIATAEYSNLCLIRLMWMSGSPLAWENISSICRSTPSAKHWGLEKQKRFHYFMPSPTAIAHLPSRE